MEQNKVVRVVVAQGYCLLREVLIERLEKETWIEVCAVASGFDETRGMLEEHRPHVLVMNVSLKCSVGISSLKTLKRDFSGMAILAFSCDSEFENAYAGQALRAGADGYISSQDSMDDFVRAIRMARDGKRVVGNSTEVQPRHSHSVLEKILLRLSRQEVEVFCLTGCGYVPQRVAKKMKLSVKTVESYRERIRMKMDLPTGADLLYTSSGFMRCAARRGIDGEDGQMVKELLSTIS